MDALLPEASICLVLYMFMQIFILCSQKSKVYLMQYLVHCSVHLQCLTGSICDIWNCLVANLLVQKCNHNFD